MKGSSSVFCHRKRAVLCLTFYFISFCVHLFVLELLYVKHNENFIVLFYRWLQESLILSKFDSSHFLIFYIHMVCGLSLEIHSKNLRCFVHAVMIFYFCSIVVTDKLNVIDRISHYISLFCFTNESTLAIQKISPHWANQLNKSNELSVVLFF